MNILITSQKAGMAGSTYSTTYLAKGLSERGHKVYLACPDNSLMQKMLKGSSVSHIPMNIRHKLDRKNIKQIANIVTEYNIDLIDGQSSKDRYTTILAKWWYRLPVKLVHTRRQLALSMGILGQSWFYEKGTDRVIAVSKGVKQSLVKIGISPEHIEVIYNGTPAEKYEAVAPEKVNLLKQQFDIKEGEFVIGCVARLKEQDQLLEALHLLDKPVKVIFVGIEPQEKYKNIIENYRLPHSIHFAGAVSNSEVLNYYPLFNVKVLPSTIEGLSQSLLEAMALKVPVVATDLGGNNELIEEGKNGFLFQHKNTRQLAEILQKLINSPQLGVQLGSFGQNTALNTFSIHNTVVKHEAMFERLLSN
ncbi:glycosyltransferase family 4 protein [Porifericola rhodea]|uniref:glycosyltransferase family 4 protein n=1 Tax=Porifericola rhodea TaxID=930972 RepID=UPI00266522A1|nr:glycosyltransferase family 4 protein [Porifericola rhodea]WKN32041.1 glycosyltransferase family 4 protein [Porifericola rhodea]